MSKTLQGHRTNLNKTITKQSPTVSSRGQTTVILCSVQYNHDRISLIIVKRRPKKYSFQFANVVSDGAFLTDDGRHFHPHAEANV